MGVEVKGHTTRYRHNTGLLSAQRNDRAAAKSTSVGFGTPSEAH